MSPVSDRQPTADDAPTVVLRQQQALSQQALPQQARPAHDNLYAAGPAPAAGPAAGPSRPRRRLGLVVGAAALVLVAAAGGAVAYASSGDIPRGSTVLGLEIGAMDREEAARALHAHLAKDARFTAPVSVAVGSGGESATVHPAEVGLQVDVDATVAAAADGNASFFDSLFGERTVTPVVTVDAERLDAVLRKSATKLGGAMRMPAVVFDGLTPKAVHPQPGRSIDPKRSAEALRAAWLSAPAGSPIAIPLVEVHPVTTAAEVDQLVETLARPAVSAPVTITTGRGTLTVPPAAIAKSLVLTADRTGKIEPRIDDKKLRAALADSLAKLETKPKDATFSLAGGRPTIVDGVAGGGLDLAATAPKLLTALQSTSERTVEGVLRTVAPAVTSEKLAALGVKEKVSTFTTKFPGGLSSPRSQNIITIAKEVDGALVMPGKVFSLNGHTGERSYAQGYKDAPVIMGGKLTPGVGGGASQFTTTLFNASYYAGLEDVEHKPHSFYFNRYPSVIESTIFYPDLDFKFRNNTEYGVLIDTSFTSSTITVSMWSTKVWDKVTTEYSPRRNHTSPRTLNLPAGPKCIATAGIPGFTQDAWRLFHRGGKVVKREKFTWRYDAEPRTVCGGADEKQD